jgi:mono/diheme cytochrome c family protein
MIRVRLAFALLLLLPACKASEDITEPLPPPISGGTLRAIGSEIVLSDPDRDRVQIVHLETSAVRTIAMQPNDEPGRVTDDGKGRAYVALRRGGAIAVIDLAQAKLAARIAVCPNPRGLEVDTRLQQLHVACSGGELVTLALADLSRVRTLRLDRDLRDVVRVGDELWVSRFRAAEILILDAAGNVTRRDRPGSVPLGNGTHDPSVPITAFGKPSVAWRLVPRPNGDGALLLHQLASGAPVSVQPGGYGAAGSPCDESLVTPAFSVLRGTAAPPWSVRFGRASLAVDAAVSPDGTTAAFVAPGNSTIPADHERGDALRESPFFGIRAENLPPASTGRDLPAASQLLLAHIPEPPAPGMPQIADCIGVDGPLASDPHEAIAVAFLDDSLVAVQTREPALRVFDLSGGARRAFIPLGSDPIESRGHALFHRATASGLACASCHPEGGDDGQTWTFDGIGPRRTQNLRGGVLQTAPFHWGGDLPTFASLVKEVMFGRMSGPPLSEGSIRKLERWVGSIPALTPSPPLDPAAAERGRELFHGASTGCADCHAGPKLTNNAMSNVGTGRALQVPSLLGVSHRAPFMHDGCAPTLRDRFGECGGGDRHGDTSHLSEPEINDLVAYLESL